MIKKIVNPKLTVAAAVVVGFVSLASSTSFAANTKISLDRAKQIAFKRAKVSASAVRNLKTELDYDDDYGRYEYEIDFYHGGLEYEITVDANSGKVLEYSAEYDD